MSSYHSPGFHTILVLIFTCCHTWHLTLLAITMGSIHIDVLMVFIIHVDTNKI